MKDLKKDLDNCLKLLDVISKKYLFKAPAIPKVSADILRTVTFLYASKINDVRVLEIGTGYGYSTLYLLRGILEANSFGKIYTIEINAKRAETVRKLIDEFKLTRYIEVIQGDALKIIPRINEMLDIVFIDGSKSEYYESLKLIQPKLKLGGVLLAHNVIGYNYLMEEFISEITKSDRWTTIICDADPEGLSISIKRD